MLVERKGGGAVQRGAVQGEGVVAWCCLGGVLSREVGAVQGDAAHNRN